MNATAYTDTDSNGGTVSWHTYNFSVPHRCCIARVAVHGNQHQRTERGACQKCGKEYVRVIRWGARDDTGWLPE